MATLAELELELGSMAAVRSVCVGEQRPRSGPELRDARAIARELDDREDLKERYFRSEKFLAHKKQARLGGR